MSTVQKELAGFSRVIVLLFNRATMYQSSHPYVKQTIEQFYYAIEQILKSISPLVFIMNGDQFFIDDEPMPSGTQTGRIAVYFNKVGIQSISFENGLDKNEITTFLDVFTSTGANGDAEAMKKALLARGVKYVKINRVFFKKVTQDHEVISREALKDLTPKLSEDAENKSKTLFIDMILERLLAEELKETVTIENLMNNPAALSEKMTKTDIAACDNAKDENRLPGQILMHQLEILAREVEENSQGTSDIESITGALFEMKRRLLQCIQAQKSMNVIYSNEDAILNKVDEITDNVILRIITDEYEAGKTSVARLAQVLPRLIPDASELKRLLPRIKSALMNQGMPLSEYLNLVRELGQELQNEELAAILRESAETIGLDSEILIEELKGNPLQAAKLIYLAAEIRKGFGDEQALSDVLVDYVDRLESKLTPGFHENGEKDLQKVLTSIESGIVTRLKSMDFKDNLLQRLEERFSVRIDEILEKFKLDWLLSHSDSAQDSRNDMSVLELLEQTVVEGDDLFDIMETIKAKAVAGELDKDNFAQIYAEIIAQQASRAREIKEKMPAGVMEASVIAVLVEKEIARARRYGIPLSMLGFSLVKASPKSGEALGKIARSRFLAAFCFAISKLQRDADIIGELGKNTIVVVLPMTSGKHAQAVLRRCLKHLHSSPIDVEGSRFDLRVAGVSMGYDSIRTIDSSSYMQALLNELTQMDRRIRNLQIYF